MYKAPSGRRKSRLKNDKPNLVPIMDAVFIFIFFLLMSANFTKIFEIVSDVPIISTNPPPEKKIPLALTLKIQDKSIEVYTGVPSSLRKSFGMMEDGKYDLDGLHAYLLDIKKNNLTENSVIFEPLVDLTYDELIKIMDKVRMIDNTDEEIFIKDKNGIDVKMKDLFSNIIFGNIQS